MITLEKTSEGSKFSWNTNLEAVAFFGKILELLPRSEEFNNKEKVLPLYSF